MSRDGSISMNFLREKKGNAGIYQIPVKLFDNNTDRNKSSPSMASY